VLLQPAAHRQQGQLLVGLADAGQVQRAREVGVVAHQRGGLLGAHPPDSVELRPVPVGVLDRQRRLANPTSALQDLRDRVSRTPTKLLGQSSKVGVTG
jgi:hypothetical protein